MTHFPPLKGISKEHTHISRATSIPKKNRSLNVFSRDYKIISKKDAKDLDSFDFYFLGEYHFSEKGKELNERFIEKLASSHPVQVVLEGRSEVEAKGIDPMSLIEAFHLDPSLKDKVTFSGWDLNEDEHPVFREEKKLHKQVLELHEKAKEMKKVLEHTKNEIEQRCPDFFKHSAEQKRLFLSNLSPEDQKFFQDHKKEMDDAQKIIDDFHFESFILVQYAIAILPARTKSMTASLKRLRLHGTTSKVVFIAGAGHFFTSPENAKLKEYDLTPFNREFKQVNGAILIPKMMMDESCSTLKIPEDAKI